VSAAKHTAATEVTLQGKPDGLARQVKNPRQSTGSKLYGMNEYLTIVHELEKARLVRQAQKDR
jgi:hypothetical protein